MNRDVQCPYCEAWQEICHDDGYGYEEGKLHQQECYECDKMFTYTTCINYDYEAQKADCLNDGEHQWERTYTHPSFLTKMRCSQCGETRPPTPSEWGQIGVDPDQDRALFLADLNRNNPL